MIRLSCKIGFSLLLTALLLAGCRFLSPRKEAKISSMSKTVALFNQGAALMEQYSYFKAAKTFERVLETAPDWTAARFNLALAYLNMQEDKGAEEYLAYAQEAFETILRSDPNHLASQFCLGLLCQHLGKNEEAVKYFEAVHRADSADLYVTYKYAETLMSLGQNDEGVELLERIIEIDPGFVSAVYRLALQHQRMRQRDKAMALFKRFQDLKALELTGGSFTVLQAYGTVGKHFIALDADNLPISRVHPKTRLLFSPQVRELESTLSNWDCPGGSVGLAGIAAGDIEGDGDIDLCVGSVGGEAATTLWLNDGSGVFSQGAVLSKNGISPCFGDVDNDGDLDLWLGRAGGDSYFENDGVGNFRVSEAEDIAGGDFVTSCSRLVDFDSDGDLDLLAFRQSRGSVPGVGDSQPGGSELYNNNRDGTYASVAEKVGLKLERTAVTAAVYDDFDNDRDLDFVIFGAGDENAIVWANDRAWKYHLLDADEAGLRIKDVVAATSGDPDEDGDRDLLVFTGRRTYLLLNQGDFRFVEDEVFGDSWGALGGTSGQFADIDNDGDLDIVVADTHRSANERGPAVLINDREKKRFIDATISDPGNLLGEIKFEGDAQCIAADFTGNGRCDIFLAPMGRNPFLIENITVGNNWLEIDLLGTRPQDSKSRSNSSALGARVELKTGAISQQYVVGIPSGMAAMPPYRIHGGLAEHTKVDWLRIMWPDAVLQAELEVPGNQVIQITELNRKTASCPHLFAWNGSRFQLISDFGGMGGLGYLVGPDTYAKPDPTEYVPVPGLAPLDGEYVLQVTEPIEETAYFDEAKLIAVDHPAGTEVYPNEMMAVNIEPPAFELFCFEETIEPVSAIDHRGSDVTMEISAIDRRYAGATQPDRRFMGFAEEHFVEVDFADRLASLAPEARLVLFLQGWVEYGYSSTNFAAGQAKMRLKAPSISVFRRGGWVELYHEVGYPAGIRHTMTLDVTGKVLPTDSRIRISSNMELYWDRIFLAPVIKQDGLEICEVSAASADLHFLGYPREYSPDGRQPNLYDYDSVDRAIAWKIMEGRYTRYGQVRELVEEADDCYVIMGRGEELTLRFPVDAFGPVPDGYRRSFILKADSFCKDMDLYSAHPDTVEPLPFHSMSNYPYGPDEKYPDNEKTRRYRGRFNTRQVGEVGR